MRWLPALLLALTVVPAAPARVPDPCSLVTKAEAARALGEPVRFSKASVDTAARRCSWFGKPILGPASTRATLTLEVEPAPTRPFAAVNAIRVDGVGERAWYSWDARLLWVWRHGLLLDVSLLGEPVDHPRLDASAYRALGVEKKVALGALGRL